MRKFKYGVIALTPLLGAGGFAQGLNLGMNDGFVSQAQAPAQTERTAQTESYGSSYGAMNGGANPETDRQPDADRAGVPMRGEIIELEPPRPSAEKSQSAENVKTAPRAQAKTQARREKKTKDIRTN